MCRNPALNAAGMMSDSPRPCMPYVPKPSEGISAPSMATNCVFISVLEVMAVRAAKAAAPGGQTLAGRASGLTCERSAFGSGFDRADPVHADTASTGGDEVVHADAAGAVGEELQQAAGHRE